MVFLIWGGEGRYGRRWRHRKNIWKCLIFFFILTPNIPYFVRFYISFLVVLEDGVLNWILGIIRINAENSKSRWPIARICRTRCSIHVRHENPFYSPFKWRGIIPPTASIRKYVHYSMWSSKPFRSRKSVQKWLRNSTKSDFTTDFVGFLGLVRC